MFVLIVIIVVIIVPIIIVLTMYQIHGYRDVHTTDCESKNFSSHSDV